MEAVKMIPKDLRYYSQFFQEYTELRVQENRSARIVIVKGNIISNTKTANSGVSARVYKNGYWGFASNPEISEHEIKTVIQSATGNAFFLCSKEQPKGNKLPIRNTHSNNDYTTSKTPKTQGEMIEFLMNLDEHIKTHCRDLSSRIVSLQTLDMEKSLLTSDGSTSYSMIPRSLIYVLMTIIKDGEPIDLGSPLGGFGQFEDAFDLPGNLFKAIDEQYKHLQDKANGNYAAAGIKDVILDAEIAGILAHEAIGHTTEADLVMGGSVAADLMGKPIAGELITLVDFANTYAGKLCPVPVFVDDEGTAAEDCVIIERGILKRYMHNKESAAIFEHDATGNARAYEFSDEPLIRMRNTAILPGKSKLADMIASIDDGYYLMKSSNGQADSTSEFMFGIVQGYQIKNGKLGKAIKDVTISGIAVDALKSVTMVSDDMIWSCAGMCGKKQLIPVGMGGPAIKCKVNIGGR
jgi:TldD protein